MASDLSSGCTEAIEVLDEKEEGEISLEDVSSSEEGHLNYGYGTRATHCTKCLSTQHNAAWCTVPAKLYHSRGSNRRDAVQGKENRHQTKDSGSIGAKHTVSTLQEKNDDLVPISSDSDMEIVGLADNSKHIVIRSSSKSRAKKKKRKKRSHALTMEDLVSSSNMDVALPEECSAPLKHEIKTREPSRSYHREISPVHRTNRTRVASRSPPRRHRPIIQPHSPFARSKSPVPHARSATMKRSPRRLKSSPTRSPYRSPPGKTLARKTSHLDLMSTSQSYVDTHKLLKKVRHLESIGSGSLEETLYKNRDPSSLKEKLSHMMKRVCDNDMSSASATRMSNLELNDADDEEDLALLRQKALETKQNKSCKQTEQFKTETITKISVDDDQDEEDLELRMIALRSAVLKKHQNRLQKGMKSGRYRKSNASRSESPFTQSFLDSIPIPGEELLSIASPPQTPTPMMENNHTEDMDLDTDVEREKEILPYSPTDKITANITIDTELLGIQPSDVSFINLNEATSSPSFNSAAQSSQEDQKSYQGKIIENRSYLPRVLYYDTPQNSFYASPSSTMQYSPVPDPRTSILHSNNSTPSLEANLNQERPYSPTDAPIYDPDLSHALPHTLESMDTPSIASLAPLGPSYILNSREESAPCSHNHDQLADDQLDRIDTLSMQPNIGSAANSQQGSESPSSSMITIDDLPEIDVDTNSMPASAKFIKCEEYSPGGGTDVVKEPLYMKGIPDVTKDVNKIPTLINRTLVPASILKTNKQLQQPLQAKRTTAPQEPTFKSAEMQPVTLPEDTRANTSFKPMKLMSFPQKSPAVLAIPTVFHDSLQEDRADEQPAGKDDSTTENNNNNATTLQTNVIADRPGKACDIVTQKKRKRGGRRRSSGAAQTKAGTNNDNTDILAKRLGEASELERREGVESNTPSNLEAPRANVLGSQASLETNESNAKGKYGLSGDTGEQAKDVDRRQSLDEDEEALRAILLASLPKRAKPSDQCSSTRVAPADAASAANSTTLPSSTSSYGSENDKNRSNSSAKTDEVAAQAGLPVGNVKAQPLANVARKRLLSVTKGPQKKHMKRIPIPASTKVVNNAKRYQNTMIQKKLNVQKAVLQYSKQKITESKLAAKVPLNDTKWPTNDTKWSTSMKSVSDTQRIVINLESDTESDSESERRAKKIALADKQSAVHPAAEFDKNLDQFLRAMRKKQESMAAARPTPLSQTLKKDSALTAKLENASNLHTPLAVRHLPASQQEEYRRLKQQILEREKLKLHRTAETSNSLKNKPAEATSKPVPSNSPAREATSKTNQSSSAKSADLNTQQLNKENCTKSLDSVKNASDNKALGRDRQETASPSQTKAASKTMPNLNICISNENSSHNVGNKIGGPSSAAAPRKVFETQNETSAKQTLSQGLKILSTDEVNKKFVQVRVQHDANERVVTISDKVTLDIAETASKTVERNENVAGSKEAVDDQAAKQSVQSVEKAIVASNIISKNNDVVDSDASTVALNGQNSTRDDNVDTDESTLRLSQCEDNSRLSISSAKSKDDGLSLFKSNLLSNDKRSMEENRETIKRDAKTELKSLILLPRAMQEEHLTETEQKLVLKRDFVFWDRFTILEDLAEMSVSLRQWNMERDLQTNLVAEVKMLREQLRVAEERLQMQRNRIHSIGPKVVVTHGKIISGRQECFKLATICSSLGSRIIGKDYKVPEAGAHLLDNKLKEVANHTRQLSRKKVPSINLPEAYELMKSDDTVSTVHSDVSQTEDLLAVQCGVDSFDNVDNADETIVSASECSMKENETLLDNVPEETTVINANEVVDREERNATANDSSVGNNVESAPQQSNTEETGDEEMLVDQPNSSSVPVIAVSKDSEEPSQNDSPDEPNDKGPPEEPTVGPESAGEPCSHDRISAKPEADRRTRKTIVPYESILVHFKVPRNTNPNGVLCPYELMGTCNDGECQFVHQRESQAK